MYNIYQTITYIMGTMYLLLGLLTTGCTHEQARLGMESGTEQEINIEPCDNCGTTSTRCKFCSRCKSVRYCSKDCQKAHWRSGHKLACRPANNAPLPAPDARITRSQGSVPTRNTISLVARRAGEEAINFNFIDAPYERVTLSNVQNRFLNEFIQIMDNARLGREAKEAALKRRAQEVFDYFKEEEGNSSPSASLAAKRKLITIVDVIKHEKYSQDWDWINWALMGVGDRNWYYLP